MKGNFMKRAILLMLTLALTLCACASGNDISEGSTQISDTVSEDVFTPAPLDNALLVVYGDSITALGEWGKTVAQNCNMRFFNGAKGGITSAEGLARFDAFVASRNPDYVTLCFGLNDLLMTAVNTPKVTPEQFKLNMKKLVEKTVDAGAVPILLTTNSIDYAKFYSAQGQSESMYGGRDIREWVDTYNEMTREVAAETGYPLIDLFAECSKHPETQVVCSDGIHLGTLGNRIFAEQITAYLLENYVSDPDSPKVDYDTSVLLSSGEKADIAPKQKNLWYIEGTTMTAVETDTAIVFKNTNSLWPDAQCALTNGIKVPVKDGVLKVKISTANVNASILLYFDGAFPHAYAEGQYLCINPKLNCNTDSYTGDITANQSIDIEIPLSSLGIPSKSIHDGYVIFSGIKLYVAGNAYQSVTVEEISVYVK